VLYRVQSQNGWSTLAVEETEARSLADAYHSQWWALGIDMTVEVYREGDLIYTATGKPAPE
jgi:hypothetical protein